MNVWIDNESLNDKTGCIEKFSDDDKRVFRFRICLNVHQVVRHFTFIGMMTGKKTIETYNTHHLRSDLRHGTGDRFSGSSIVGHFEFHWVTDFQMFYISVELTKVEKQTSLPLAALDKTIWMLQRENLTPITLPLLGPSNCQGFGCPSFLSANPLNRHENLHHYALFQQFPLAPKCITEKTSVLIRFPEIPRFYNYVRLPAYKTFL